MVPDDSNGIRNGTIRKDSTPASKARHMNFRNAFNFMFAV